jgi:hypothetical protein
MRSLRGNLRRSRLAARECPESRRTRVAATPGEQIIRLTFDEPQNISKIYLLFEETAQVRSQEFVLSWQQAVQPEWREIVRQQFNFSPSGTTVERENFKVSLERASALQLLIAPERSGGGHASLSQLRIG